MTFDPDPLLTMTLTQTSAPSLTFRELLDYTATENERWESWLSKQPAAILDLPVGEERTATVRGLLQHIFAVERRYADRLQGQPVSAYDVVDATTVAALFAGGRDSRERLEKYLATATDDDLGRPLEFQTLTAGMQSASARKIVAHTLLHGIRHWAQLATALRQQGYKTDWQHDLLTSPALI
jgi:uncharacterized damage-inducible protein DinB